MERGVNIKILTPINNDVQKIVQGIIEEIGGQEKRNFEVRAVDVTYETSTVNTVTIIIVDKKTSLVIEKLDDSKENFIDAIGLTTYSNSKPTVSSYISIFESLWNQTKLYEELKKHSKMQQEFINIAAHELRTPAQSLLGYAQLAKSNPHYIEKQVESFIDVIYRNSFRIHKLTKDILDITRIESQTLYWKLQEEFLLDFRWNIITKRSRKLNDLCRRQAPQIGRYFDLPGISSKLINLKQNIPFKIVNEKPYSKI